MLLFLFLACTLAYSDPVSRGSKLGAPTALQLAIDSAIAAGDPSFSLTPNSVYTQGASSLIITASGFSLLGNNATLSFAPGYGVLFDQSLDVSVERLSVTYSPPCFTQGTVVAHTGASTFDIQLDAGYPSPNASFFSSVETKLQFFDGSSRGRVPGQSGSCIVDVLLSPAPGVWRVGVSKGFGCTLPSVTPLLATISPRVFAEGFQIPQGYRGSAWWAFNSTRVTATDITLYGSGNFAFTDNSATLTRLDSNLLSSNTDGFHSFGTQVGPTLLNCSLSWMGDDVLNFHNRVGLVLTVGAGDLLQVIDVGDMPTPAGDEAHPARALASLVAGRDALQLSSPSGAPRGGGAPLPVAAITWSTDPAAVAAAQRYMAQRPGVPVNPAGVGVWSMQVLGAGAGGVVVGDVVQFDRQACRGARVQGCTFTDAYDSCFRMQAGDSLVQGNTWQRIPGGFAVVYDPQWLEGSSDIASVLVQGNTFEAVLHPPATTTQQIFSVDGSVRNFTQRNNSVVA